MRRMHIGMEEEVDAGQLDVTLVEEDVVLLLAGLCWMSPQACAGSVVQDLVASEEKQVAKQEEEEEVAKQVKRQLLVPVLLFLQQE